jgi:hypothetical protein
MHASGTLIPPPVRPLLLATGPCGLPRRGPGKPLNSAGPGSGGHRKPSAPEPSIQPSLRRDPSGVCTTARVLPRPYCSCRHAGHPLAPGAWPPAQSLFSALPGPTGSPPSPCARAFAARRALHQDCDLSSQCQASTVVLDATAAQQRSPPPPLAHSPFPPAARRALHQHGRHGRHLRGRQPGGKRVGGRPDRLAGGAGASGAGAVVPATVWSGCAWVGPRLRPGVGVAAVAGSGPQSCECGAPVRWFGSWRRWCEGGLAGALLVRRT